MPILHASHTPTQTDARTDLTPELELAGAILRQAVKDLHDPRPHVRDEASAFWQNAATVAYWSELAGIDLKRHAPLVPPQPHEQLSLFAWVKATAAVLVLSAALLTGCAPAPKPPPPARCHVLLCQSDGER